MYCYHLFQVQVKMSLSSISEYDVITGKLTVSGYLTLRWVDELLQWKSEDFDGVSKINVAQGEIWTPEIQQIADSHVSRLFTSVWLNEDGNASMVVTGELIGYCDVDILYFPMDEKTCCFPLIAPNNEAAELQLSLLNENIETTSSLAHGEWNIIGSGAYTILYKEGDIGIEVMGLHFELRLRRRPMLVLIHTTTPLFLIALLNMMIYVVPIESGERISFSVTVLLALIFFTSNIGDSIPHTALNVPILSMVTAALITLCTVNVIISVIFSRIASEKIKPVSGCIHSFVSFFLTNKFGNMFKKQHAHPGEVINAQTGENVISEKVETEITWMMVVDIYDWIMFYVHLMVVATAVVLATLLIANVI